MDAIPLSKKANQCLNRKKPLIIYKTCSYNSLSPELMPDRINYFIRANYNLGGDINWEIGIDTDTTIHKRDNNDLLHSIGNATQYSIMTSMGTDSYKELIHTNT